MVKVKKSEWFNYICKLDRASLLTLLVGGFREVDILEMQVSSSGALVVKTEKSHFNLSLVEGWREF